MSPQKLEKCVRKVKKKIRKGKIKGSYRCGKNKRCPTNAWKICKASLASAKKRKKKK